MSRSRRAAQSTDSSQTVLMCKNLKQKKSSQDSFFIAQFQINLICYIMI